MAGNSLRQQLIEADEMLKILETYLGGVSEGETFAHHGVSALIKESRARLADAMQGRENPESDTRGIQRSSKSLASRIQRLPEGELRTTELDLDMVEGQPQGKLRGY